jgi:anaerobic magnesium-protoporphyrin IX monomethyl ester cyclase
LNKKNKIILFNPRSAQRNFRLPISLLQVGASIYGKHDFVFLDGNLEPNSWQKLNDYLATGEFAFFACSVMPGPQLKEAVKFTKAVRNKYPGIVIIWGGYFASIHFRVCIESGIIDYIIRGPGDYSFPELINCLIEGRLNHLNKIENLVFRMPGGELMFNPVGIIPDQDKLPDLPLEFFGTFYPIENYIIKTFIGNRTLSYHSSIGCPNFCNFCGVASVYNSAWKGKSAGRMFEEILHLKIRYRIDAIEFHDSNFFCSKSRTIEFCRMMKGQKIQWWAEGRIDSMNNYSDDELQMIRESGCRLVFMGAETGNNSLLSRINKGETFSADYTTDLVKRFSEADIIPELSFVFGFPDSSKGKIMKQMHEDIQFIRSLKKLNPRSETVIYLFTPVPAEGSELYKIVQEFGFVFPESLDKWLTKEWESYDLRRDFIMPWLSAPMIRTIRDFEVVLSAAYPSLSNFQISRIGKIILKIPGKIRYRLRFYRFPIEIKALLKLFSYQRPEKEGFYSK